MGDARGERRAAGDPQGERLEAAGIGPAEGGIGMARHVEPDVEGLVENRRRSFRRRVPERLAKHHQTIAGAREGEIPSAGSLLAPHQAHPSAAAEVAEIATLKCLSNPTESVTLLSDEPDVRRIRER
ncbi:MAG TPA: hypothetical protein VKA30_02140, partial [Actinomycetota bacterium]|nr:hypothetical protein [Actinomycetota bacterium]